MPQARAPPVADLFLDHERYAPIFTGVKKFSFMDGHYLGILESQFACEYLFNLKALTPVSDYRETIYRNGHHVGWLSSGGFGHHLQIAIGLGYIRHHGVLSLSLIHI